MKVTSEGLERNWDLCLRVTGGERGAGGGVKAGG